MENKKLTSIICLHLSAGFDTVNHSILLEVMENFGITNTALKWISSFLKNRKFSVHIDDVSSNIKTINFSVPQGGILGSTIFNCYVSTLMEMEENVMSGYADDHALINSSHPENAEIFSSLASIIVCIQN